jgi:branched-chain amino acid transport system substrate-binding protein
VSAFGGHAWDAVKLLEAAILKAKSSKPEAIRKALEQTKGFWGIGGQFTFSPTDHAGLTEDSMVMVKIVKGEWELLP